MQEQLPRRDSAVTRHRMWPIIPSTYLDLTLDLRRAALFRRHLQVDQETDR